MIFVEVGVGARARFNFGIVEIEIYLEVVEVSVVAVIVVVIALELGWLVPHQAGAAEILVGGFVCNVSKGFGLVGTYVQGRTVTVAQVGFGVVLCRRTVVILEINSV